MGEGRGQRGVGEGSEPRGAPGGEAGGEGQGWALGQAVGTPPEPPPQRLCAFLQHGGASGSAAQRMEAAAGAWLSSCPAAGWAAERGGGLRGCGEQAPRTWGCCLVLPGLCTHMGAGPPWEGAHTPRLKLRSSSCLNGHTGSVSVSLSWCVPAWELEEPYSSE